MKSKFCYFYTANRSPSNWVDRADYHGEEYGGFVRRLSVEELPNWAEELWVSYAGDKLICRDDEIGFAAYIGENAKAVVAKIRRTHQEVADCLWAL